MKPESIQNLCRPDNQGNYNRGVGKVAEVRTQPPISRRPTDYYVIDLDILDPEDHSPCRRGDRVKKIKIKPDDLIPTYQDPENPLRQGKKVEYSKIEKVRGTNFDFIMHDPSVI